MDQIAKVGYRRVGFGRVEKVRKGSRQQTLLPRRGNNIANGETTIRHMRKDGSILDIRLDCNHRSGSADDMTLGEIMRTFGQKFPGYQRTRKICRSPSFDFFFDLRLASRIPAMMYFYSLYT